MQGLLLFNIITGLLVDGFGRLREDDNTQQDILVNSCFTCGTVPSPLRAFYHCVRH